MSQHGRAHSTASRSARKPYDGAHDGKYLRELPQHRFVVDAVGNEPHGRNKLFHMPQLCWQYLDHHARHDAHYDHLAMFQLSPDRRLETCELHP